jgi:dTDP-3-amino-3,4,6-trideoxy-alpha-D-glucose transaminase
MTTGPNIPLVRLDNADPAVMEELLETVRRIAEKGAFTLGPEVEAFEEEYADYCGADHAIGVSSGTEALALVLRALDVGRGDEVIVPANSFIATAEAVSLVGATPCFVDVCPRTALITAEGVAAAIGPLTRAVIPVHLYGRTLDLDPILALAGDRGVAVIEDACQAHGALHHGQRAGSLGDAGCFSFYPAKNLGAWGDGGAVVTSDERLADRIRLLRSHGERSRYHHEVIGTTARLDALQAAILRVKLRRLDEWNERRRRVGSALVRALDGGPVCPPPPAPEGSDHVFHQFVVQSDNRDALRKHLASCGVASAIHYPIPLHRTPAYASASHELPSLPVADALATRICSLPINPNLSEGEIGRIVGAVSRFHAPAQPSSDQRPARKPPAPDRREARRASARATSRPPNQLPDTKRMVGP